MRSSILTLALLALPSMSFAGQEIRHAPGVHTFTNNVRVSVQFGTENNPNERTGVISPRDTADLGYAGNYAPAHVYGTYTVHCPTKGYGFVEHVNISEEVSMGKDVNGKPFVVYSQLNSFSCELNDYGG